MYGPLNRKSTLLDCISLQTLGESSCREVVATLLLKEDKYYVKRAGYIYIEFLVMGLAETMLSFQKT